MGTYYVPTTTNTVDGTTLCGGACTAADTIIIEGGPRGNLLFKDFNGSGSYIPIINENGTSKVEITNDANDSKITQTVTELSPQAADTSSARLSETLNLTAEMFEGTITDLYIPRRKPRNRRK